MSLTSPSRPKGRRSRTERDGARLGGTARVVALIAATSMLNACTNAEVATSAPADPITIENCGEDITVDGPITSFTPTTAA